MRAMLVILLAFPIGAQAGAFEDGLRFLDRKAYGKAATAFRAAAAQNNVAFIYRLPHAMLSDCFLYTILCGWIETICFLNNIPLYFYQPDISADIVSCPLSGCLPRD